MKKNLKIFITLTCFLLLASFITASAQTMTETEYRKTIAPEFPDVLNVGVYQDCGNFAIKIGSAPIVTKSANKLAANDDLSYLVMRVSIKNLSDRIVSWLSPKSFTLTEYFMDNTFTSYGLNRIMSAKAAAGFSIPAFFAPIQPGAEISTAIAFEVYGDVDGWILTFSPFQRTEEGPETEIRFTLPKAQYQ